MLKNFSFCVLLFLILFFQFPKPLFAQENTGDIPLVHADPQIEILVHSRIVVVKNSNELDVITFPAATARSDSLVPVDKSGYVEEIILNPHWQPTKNVRKRYLRKHGVELPEYVPPMVKLNALGRLALKLSFVLPEGKVLKIHGTNEPNSIGKRASSGCAIPTLKIWLLGSWLNRKAWNGN